MKDTSRVCFARDTFSLSKKQKWLDLSACHAGMRIESFSRSLSEVVYILQ